MVKANPKAVLLLGLQGGDEGKGKWAYEISHAKRKQGGVAVRIGGGANAGHTICPAKQDGFVVFGMLPAAIDNSWIKVIGRGVMFHPKLFLKEVAKVGEMGYDNSPKKIMVDASAFLAWDVYGERDAAEEALRGTKAVGTLKMGVGPAAADYTAREGMYVGDLLLPIKKLREKITEETKRQNRLLRSLKAKKHYSVKEVEKLFLGWRKTIGPYIKNTFSLITTSLKKGNFIGEGAQAFRLSRDTGFRGNVTSTDSGPGPLERRYRTSRDYAGQRIGVIKLIPTLVGNHMIHSPLPDKLAQILYQKTAERGNPEEGAVSKRKRKFYWLSVPELRAAIATYGINALVISKVDVVDVLPYIELGLEYVFPDGTKTKDYDPDDARMFKTRTKMRTIKFKGWLSNTGKETQYQRLPAKLRRLIKTLEKLVDTPIVAVGTGPKLGEVVWLKARVCGK